MKSVDLNHLFIYDLANNHQGDVDHALTIIREVGKVTQEAKVKAALKFQFRDLDTFVHPHHKENSNNKHVPRFLGTRLSVDDFSRLAEEVRNQGMYTMSTPFDERSVDTIEEMSLDIIKIASCSATDRPLLKRISQTNKPVIASTGGLTFSEIDFLVSLFEEKQLPFALMHCVAIYPTPNEKLRLNQIALLKARYGSIPVGWSTHEDQDDLSPIQIAYAKGARLFERHVGLQTDKYSLNAYSSTPKQLAKWLAAYRKAVEACGGDQRAPGYPEELESLRSLARGVFAKRPIKKGEPLKRSHVYFAMPMEEGQLSSGNFSSSLTADRNYEPDEAIAKGLPNAPLSEDQLIFEILVQVKGMLNNSNIPVGKDSSIEISHHYGLERFREFGAVIVNCINRSYCKKLIVVLPRQKHPYHFHKKKEETFQLLSGDLEVEIEGKRQQLAIGDTALVEPNQWHKFHTLDGAIFEELSTTHYNNDSFYEDETIALLPREKRKTTLPNWEVALSKHG